MKTEYELNQPLIQTSQNQIDHYYYHDKNLSIWENGRKWYLFFVVVEVFLSDKSAKQGKYLILATDTFMKLCFIDLLHSF